MPGPMDCKIYVGDLGSEANKQDLEDAFSTYGRLRNVWLARNPPGFAFLEFEDSRDAEDAVRGLDGRMICGRRARVEFSRGKTRNRGGRDSHRRGGGGGYGGGGGGGGGRSFHPEDRCYECGETGHYARDCYKYSRHRSRNSRSRSRSPPPRRRSNSRSRSRERSRRGRSRSNEKSRSYSRERSMSRGRTHSRSRSRGKDVMKRSRSRSAD